MMRSTRQTVMMKLRMKQRRGIKGRAFSQHQSSRSSSSAVGALVATLMDSTSLLTRRLESASSLTSTTHFLAILQMLLRNSRGFMLPSLEVHCR